MKKIKAIIEVAKMSFTSSRLAYEQGFTDGFEQGRRQGHEEGKVEGVRVWAAMHAENEAAKIKETS
jgi:flagellar biosynthesis/type III secretory pathway protein FliH